MSVTYTYNPNWINRDSQPDGSNLRVVKAADFEAEWLSIQTAFNKCAPAANPVFTGTVTSVGITASGNITAPNLNVSNWDTAYGWGDHSVVGYLTSVDAPTTAGVGATGTWDISITGNAATATAAESATTAGTCTGNSATATTATDCSRSVVAGTNLSGGGVLSADVTVDLVAEPSLTSVVLGNFKIRDDGTNLIFSHSGDDIMVLSSAGLLRADGDIWANDSI